jgi:hypothetical protein
MTVIDRYLDTIAEQNIYNNTKGKIPRSTFINKWHNETTNELIEIMKGCLHHIDAGTSNPDLEECIGTLSVWIKQHKDKPFVNICNPSLKEINQCKKSHAWDWNENAKNIKSVYFKMKRLMAEYYNKEFSVDIVNDSSDINRYPLDWNGLKPTDKSTPYEELFE